MDFERHSPRRRRRILGFISLPQWLEFTLLGLAATTLFVLSGVIVWALLVPIPAINSFENRQVAQSTKIYDRTGNIVLYDVHGAVRRTSVPLDQMSVYIRNASIAVEDATFYTNSGFRPLSFARAVFANLFSRSYGQGGSTITQQVVKNALLTQNKTITRKIEEIILALRLNKAYSKDEILNTYLNETPYGGTIYGIEEASQYFFGVSAKDIDLAQAAYLAAIPQAPTYYSPYGNHKQQLDARKNYVLARMKENKFITDEEYQKARAEEVQFKNESEAGIKAPHFVFFVREYLEEKYGVDAVNHDGLRVITTLDYDLQQKAEDTVAKFAPNMQKNFNATNEGMVAIDPKTGQILAMVGSRGYFDDTIDGKVNVTVALRQPGSSFKPFVYATAFKKGYTPDTIVYDVPTQFSTRCGATDIMNDTPPCYSPSNYDGTFKGPMTFRNALAQSENIPAVKALYLAGIQDSINTAKDLGITTLVDAARYGLTLVLGGGEVRLLDMTGAYAVFANDGVKNTPTGILEVRDMKGKVLEAYTNQNTRVLDPQIARQINDVLSDNVARTPEFGADSPLNFSKYNVADKTGTTNDFHDVWIVGYTPGISVGAWAGNNDNAPMAKKIAAFIIAPMWHEFMQYAVEKYASDDFVPPAPDPDLETLPPVLKGNPNTNPSLGVHDILFWVQKDNPRAGMPSSPYSDSQAERWDYAAQAWTGNSSGTPTPGGSGNPGAPGSLMITSPQAGVNVSGSAAFSITASYANPGDVQRIVYYLNNQEIGSAVSPPYQISVVPTSHGPAVLRAVAQLQSGMTVEQSVAFTIQ
jgi:1A family penicillin-binding protein